MELAKTIIPTQIKYAGFDKFTMVAKEKFKLKVGDEYVIDEKVPDDKVWAVTTQIVIDETDA